ncbi:MAG: hypothetical protein GX558_05140 [Clostridiales bacterium]|nr:hypothetical protein [Clostridiales bacterium]
MRRIIDRAAAWALLCALAFVYFLWAIGSIAAACVLTLTLAVCARRVSEGVRKRTEARRRRRGRARARLDAWLCADRAQAALDAACAVCRAYQLPPPTPIGDGAMAVCGDTPVRMELVQWPRAGRPFDAADILPWHSAMRGEQALVLMVTSPVPARAAAFAKGLKAPKMRIIDATLLVEWLAEQPDNADDIVDTAIPEAREKGRLSAALIALAGSVRPARLFKYALVMLAMYLALGAIAYLPASLALFLLAGFSVRRPRAGRKLI